MPERTTTQPTYKTQTVKGVEYAYTRVDGRRISLGRAGTSQALEKFRRILGEWQIAKTEQEFAHPHRLTVGELAEQYLVYSWRRVDAGFLSKSSGHLAEYAAKAVTLDSEHSNTPVNLFGTRAFKAIQRRLSETKVQVGSGRFCQNSTPPTLSRRSVSDRMNAIRAMFRWGVSEELVPASVLASLKAVPGLREGEARETKPRQPADPQAVSATVRVLETNDRAHIAAIVKLIRWTGCRPAEICNLTAGEIVDTPEGLELRIEQHKTRKHTETARIVVLNDQAQRLVQEALASCRNISPDRHLFVSKSGRPLTPNGLYQAVRKAAAAAGVSHWSPYMLRHLAAIEMLEAGATEAEAAAAIGHSPNSTVIRRYSRGREKLARRAAAGIGSREAI